MTIKTKLTTQVIYKWDIFTSTGLLHIEIDNQNKWYHLLIQKWEF